METTLKRFTKTVKHYDSESSVICVVNYQVHGFWSKSYITVSFRRLGRRDVGLPVADISWSCGGHDLNEEPDRNVAALCFAAALQDAVEVAKELVQNQSNVVDSSLPTMLNTQTD